MKKWFLAFLITCVITFIMVGITTMGTPAAGLHTHIALGILGISWFGGLVYLVKQILDQ